MKIAMRAACPKCEAVYDLPAEMTARLPAAVRCATCGHVWDLRPDDAAGEASAETPPAADPPAAPGGAEAEAAPADEGGGTASEAAAEPMSDPEASGAETSLAMPAPAVFAVPGSMPAAEGELVAESPAAPWPSERVQWMVSAGVLAVLILLLFALHGPIGRAWPPSLRLYGLFGLG
jgi:predicted Zn finger-like uncharacterized protein